jgi:hypothetical protein
MTNIIKYPRVSLENMVSFISLNHPHYTILNMKIEMNDYPVLLTTISKTFSWKETNNDYVKKQIPYPPEIKGIRNISALSGTKEFSKFGNETSLPLTRATE